MPKGSVTAHPQSACWQSSRGRMQQTRTDPTRCLLWVCNVSSGTLEWGSLRCSTHLNEDFTVLLVKTIAPSIYDTKIAEHAEPGSASPLHALSLSISRLGNPPSQYHDMIQWQVKRIPWLQDPSRLLRWLTARRRLRLKLVMQLPLHPPVQLPGAKPLPPCTRTLLNRRDLVKCSQDLHHLWSVL